MKMVMIKIFLLMIVSYLQADVWNNPHSKEKSASNTLFSSFSLSPKRLDPVVSYNSNEWAFISQIYEPPLQYNYLQRPYKIEPLTLIQMPTIRYLDSNRQEVDENDERVAFTEYRLEFRKDVKYQDHPSFAKDANGNLLYTALSEEALEKIETLEDFEQ